MSSLCKYRLIPMLFQLIYMNRLVFDSQTNNIYEWAPVCLSEPQIADFQLIVDRTCNYLTVISNTKIKYRPILSKCSHHKTPPSQKIPAKIKYKHLRKAMFLSDETRIQNVIREINQLKIQFQAEFQNSSKTIPHRLKKEKDKKRIMEESQTQLDQEQKTALLWKEKIKICENHLKQLKAKAVHFYAEFIEKQNRLLQTFVHFKLNELNQKLTNVSDYLYYQSTNQSLSENIQLQDNIRVLFDNLYIQGEYLRMLIKKNLLIFQKHSYYEYSGEQPEVMAVRQRQFMKIKKIEKETEELKQKIRQLYFLYYGKKRSKMIIKNPRKLQSVIRHEVAINSEQYKNVQSWITWSNGFICSVLLFALAAIIIFRQINISQLQRRPNYQLQFQVWRGASYLIWFNWVFAIVFYLLVRWKVNYKLVLLESDNFVGKYQSFFWTASLLSAIFLVLFLVYLLYQLEYIQGHPQIQNMGYFMWIINIVFLLNPFKILNYQSRVYFLNLLKKMIFFEKSPNNFQIAFFSLIIASCAQPFNDFAFTACSVIYGQQKKCQSHSRVATFIFMMIYLFYRILIALRVWCSAKEGADISKTKMRFVSILCSTNTVISSFLYRTYANSGLLIYWIISGAISTIAVTNAQLRADWNIANSDQQDTYLKHARTFPTCTYYACAVVDLILNIAWTLTISNNVQVFLNIDVLYFFMLLAFIELWRRGMWMALRIEEAHSRYVMNLTAMADDSDIQEQVEKAIDQVRSQNRTNQCQHQPYEQNVAMVLQYLARQYLNYNEQIKEVPKIESRQSITLRPKPKKKFASVRLQHIQSMILYKQKYVEKVGQFLEGLADYLSIVYEHYQELTWEDEY